MQKPFQFKLHWIKIIFLLQKEPKWKDKDKNNYILQKTENELIFICS